LQDRCQTPRDKEVVSGMQAGLLQKNQQVNLY